MMEVLIHIAELTFNLIKINEQIKKNRTFHKGRMKIREVFISALET